MSHSERRGGGCPKGLIPLFVVFLLRGLDIKTAFLCCFSSITSVILGDLIEYLKISQTPPPPSSTHATPDSLCKSRDVLMRKKCLHYSLSCAQNVWGFFLGQYMFFKLVKLASTQRTSLCQTNNQ